MSWEYGTRPRPDSRDARPYKTPATPRRGSGGRTNAYPDSSSPIPGRPGTNDNFTGRLTALPELATEISSLAPPRACHAARIVANTHVSTSSRTPDKLGDLSYVPHRE